MACFCQSREAVVRDTSVTSIAVSVEGDVDCEASSTYMVKKMSAIRISNQEIAEVKRVLEYNSRKYSAESTPYEAISLAKNVNPQQFRKWASRKEEREIKEWGLKLEYVNCGIIGSELAGRGHGAGLATLNRFISAQDPNYDLMLTVDEDVNFPQGEQYKGDVIINVKGLYTGPSPHLVNLSGNMFPTVVIEVGVAQTVPDLCKKLDLYKLIPSIQIYVAIKRFASDGMVAISFHRAMNWDPVAIVSFGLVSLHHLVLSFFEEMQWNQYLSGVGFNGPPCNAPNLPRYMISLPSQMVFAGRQGGISLGAPQSYNIDLYRMQEALSL